MKKNEKELFKISQDGNGIIFCPPKQEEKVFKNFKPYNSLYNMVWELMRHYKALGYGEQTRRPTPPVKMYKDFYAAFGVTPSAVKTIHTALSFRVWVEPHKKLLDGIAYNASGKATPWIVNKVWSNKEVLAEALDDGLDNIACFVALLGANPAQLRKAFGKATWARLANNSKTRNYLICKSLIKNPRLDFNEENLQVVEIVRYLSELPSGVLKVIRPIHMEEFKYAYKNVLQDKLVKTQASVLSNRPDNSLDLELYREFHHTLQIFRDTKSMSGQLVKPFNPRWSPSKMVREHDKYSEEVSAKQYPDTEYSILPWLRENNLETIIEGDAKATFIKSPRDLNMEGLHMKHCVSSYSSRVSAGTYLVYSITCDGVRSTLGIMVHTDRNRGLVEGLCETLDGRSFTINQIYGKCNSHVSCEKTLKLANKVEESLTLSSMRLNKLKEAS